MPLNYKMGKNVVDPVEINTVFTKYYKDLYKSEYSDSANKKKKFTEDYEGTQA